jgi:arylformamidase
VAVFYDISLPIYEGMPVYKNKPEKQTTFETTADFSSGTSHETRIHMDAHAGTHVDAPLHMTPGGATIETLDVQRLMRNVKVIDMTHVVDHIALSDVEPLGLQRGDFVLFKTSNSFDQQFNAAFVFIAKDAAKYLAEAGIDGVGVDGLGIERSQPGHETHKLLMDAGVIILEGLALQEVPAGEYWMAALPLRLIGTDAAPVRAVLLDKR